ncbi:TetR/AcrR family transcriptional regulator [Kitasatospora sp. NPDC050543]|uniref:TetR/AcrR family transcriptional regulator n=1 Tax=Kitasatospora sp. NPDC050543 TaxID=3364054 RepID=UPI00379CE64C
MATTTPPPGGSTREPDGLSLRERKKLRTGAKLWSTAIALFQERGFDQVSVAEIAAAAEVSKMTVFNYFPAKEDLVMRPMEDHVDETARVVRERPAGCSPLAAVRAHFLAALAAHDPATGLCDQEPVLGVLKLIRDTPSLALRAQAISMRSEELLGAELAAQRPDHDPLTAEVAAAQIMGARRALILENQRRVLAGESAASAEPRATAEAARAFALVEEGLAGYCGG